MTNGHRESFHKKIMKGKKLFVVVVVVVVVVFGGGVLFLKKKNLNSDGARAGD